MATGAYDRHLRRLRGALKHRSASRPPMRSPRYFPAGTRMNVPPGGLAAVGGIAGARCRRHAVFDAALAERILIAPGTLFSNSSRFDHFMRINCGWPYGRGHRCGLAQAG